MTLSRELQQIQQNPDNCPVLKARDGDHNGLQKAVQVMCWCSNNQNLGLTNPKISSKESFYVRLEIRVFRFSN